MTVFSANLGTDHDIVRPAANEEHIEERVLQKHIWQLWRVFVILIEFPGQLLHGFSQLRQGCLDNIPDCRSPHCGVTVNQLIAECDDQRDVRNTGRQVWIGLGN